MMKNDLSEIKKNKSMQDFVDYLESNLESYLPPYKAYYSYYYYLSGLKEELGLDNSSFNLLVQKAREIAFS